MNTEFLTTRRFGIAMAVMLVIAFFGPATGQATFFYRDFGVLAYPTASYHREMFWRSELPLWNPYSNCGVPFLAQWGTMTLYPLSLIYLVLPLPWSLNVFCLLHLWIGGMGVFLLAKNWTGSKAAAGVAGTLFLFNGITLSSLSWPNYTVAFAWMPWVVLFVERAWKNRAQIPIAAMVGTLQMLSGVPELIVLTWLLVAALWIAEMINASNRTVMTINAGAVVLLVAGLSAIQLLPFFELLSLSHRQAGVGVTKWALPFSGLANFALPMLHAFKTPQGTWFQTDQHFLSSTYLSLAALCLSLFGAVAGGLRARFLALAAFFSVVLALGPNLPTFALLERLPLIGLARYPVKFTLLLPLTISLLAAFGIKAFEEKKFSFKTFLGVALVFLITAILLIYWTHLHPLKYDRWPETFANSVVRLIFFIAALGLFYGWLKNRRPEFFALLLILIFVDGRFHLQNQNPTTSVATLKAGLQERGLPKLGQGRIFISPEAEDTLLQSSLPDLQNDFIGKQLAEWSHLNLVDLVPKVNGSATLNIREQKEVQDWLYSKTNVNREAWLDFLGVTHTTAPSSIVEWTNRTSVSPLLRLVRETANPDWHLDPPRGSGAEVEMIRFAPHEITARVQAKTPAQLEVAQTWSPSWRVEVNGKLLPKSEVIRVNHAFLAFLIPSGESRIRIYYRDQNFIAGAIVSLLSLTVCCGLFWLAKR